jgi:hypothetical protein
MTVLRMLIGSRSQVGFGPSATKSVIYSRHSKGAAAACARKHGLAQRQYRLSHGKLGVEVVTDPDLHKALLLMRAAGIRVTVCILTMTGTSRGT